MENIHQNYEYLCKFYGAEWKKIYKMIVFPSWENSFSPAIIPF